MFEFFRKFFGVFPKRLIAYGDIHRCLDEFIELRQKIRPRLGDIINKGPYSKELI